MTRPLAFWLQRLLIACLGGAALLCAHAANAQTLFFTLTPQGVGPASPSVLITGSLVNPTLSDVLVNDIQVSLSGSAATFLTPDANPFFANVPGIFAPGDTYNGVIFGLQIAPGTPLASYSGTVTLQGDPNGADPGATQNLATATFQLAVAPEPGAGLLAVVALPFAATVIQRRRTV
jgi:hypothetical protein